jgi:hypothetical protein
MARPKAGSNLSITQLESILQSRLAELQQLTKEHSKLSGQLAEIEKKIAALGGRAKGRGRISGFTNGFGGGGVRMKNEKSLVETLDQVLGAASEPMKVGDIVEAVLKAGYHTTSDNFRGIVNQTLIKERRHFVSAGRGLYAAKGKAK